MGQRVGLAPEEEADAVNSGKQQLPPAPHLKPSCGFMAALEDVER